MNFKLLFAAFLLAAAGRAMAHPVSFQGATSVMTWNQPYLTDIWTTYSFSPKFALAARAMRMDMDDGSQMEVYMPQADYLVYRRNGETYQANFYVFGGYGAERMDDESSGAGLVGVELDAEDLRYYSSLQFQAVLPGKGPNTYSTTAKAGISAYPAKFDEMATWFIVAYQHNPQLVREQDVTPMVRLMYHRMLMEVGAGFSGDWMLNLMVHF